MERQHLQEQHQLLRAREAAIWEKEEEQMKVKHALKKRHVNDIFQLKRQQILSRHEKVRFEYQLLVSFCLFYVLHYLK